MIESGQLINRCGQGLIILVGSAEVVARRQRQREDSGVGAEKVVGKW